MRHQGTPTLLLPSSASLYTVAGTTRRHRQNASLLRYPFYTNTPRIQSPDPHPVAQVSQGGAHSRQPQDRVSPLPSPFLFLQDRGAANLSFTKCLIRAQWGWGRGGESFFLSEASKMSSPLGTPHFSARGAGWKRGTTRYLRPRPDKFPLAPPLALAGVEAGRGELFHIPGSFADPRAPRRRPRSVPRRGTPLTPQRKSSWQPPPGSWSDNRAGCSPRGCSIWKCP